MRNWTAAAVTIILAAFCIMVLSAISAEMPEHEKVVSYDVIR